MDKRLAEAMQMFDRAFKKRKTYRTLSVKELDAVMKGAPKELAPSLRAFLEAHVPFSIPSENFGVGAVRAWAGPPRTSRS